MAETMDGLEKRLREREPVVRWSCEFKRNACRNPDGCHCAEIESLQVRVNQVADALAKARVVVNQFGWEYGVMGASKCKGCGTTKARNQHTPNCPIGAALEALK